MAQKNLKTIHSHHIFIIHFDGEDLGLRVGSLPASAKSGLDEAL